MKSFARPTLEVPVTGSFDLCVVGGSCTGVFAAVRAARLGLSVAIVEQQNCFGGVATCAMVNVWHSTRDTDYRTQVIGGLSCEVMERLARRDAVTVNERSVNEFVFNSEELKIELDELVIENRIMPFLHTKYVESIADEDEISAIIVANKSGYSAIEAKFYIDATGDGDLARQIGLDVYSHPYRQPPTMGAKLIGLTSDHYDMPSVGGVSLNKLLDEHGSEFGLEEGWGWSAAIPGLPGVTFQANTRINRVDVSNAADLTKAEIEGRRQVRAMMDIVRKHGPQSPGIGLVALPSYVGTRESIHVRCQYQLTEADVLDGVQFDDGVVHGTYRVDVHKDDLPGVTFKYLDGTQVYYRSGHTPAKSRWREGGPDSNSAKYWSVPLRSLVPHRVRNLMLAGRFLDADAGAFAAIRVMISMNQTGEAAGVAAFTALSTQTPIQDVDASEVRRLMNLGGSMIQGI